jgi:hypothetical protein
LPTGEHTVRLEALYDASNCNTANDRFFTFCTLTDFSDLFRVSVVELTAAG